MYLYRFLTKDKKDEVFVNLDNISHVRKCYGTGTVTMYVGGESFDVDHDDYDKAMEEYKKEHGPSRSPLITALNKLTTAVERLIVNLPHSLRVKF